MARSLVIPALIADLDMSVRCHQTLKANDITLTSQLQSLTIDQIRSLRNITSKSIIEIVELLDSLGVSVAVEENVEIKLLTHFVITTPLADGIRDLQFKHISDYIDAIEVLKKHLCRYTFFQAHEGDYHHIFTNEQGLATLSIHYS
jgi:hypothetical protein